MALVGFTLTLAMAPAPPPLLEAVQQIEVETSTDVASVFRLRIGIAQNQIGDWSVLQYDLFRPMLPVGIRITSGLPVPTSVINGYVTRQDVTYSDEPGQSTLEVTGMDATLLMNLHEKSMPWPNMPDSAIAAAIFGQYALVPKVTPTAPTLIEPVGTTTQRGTDIRFLRRLARRNGFDCYVQPEPLTGVDIGHFEKPSTLGVPSAVLSVNMGAESTVREFRVRYDMVRPTTAVAAGIDIQTKTPQLGLSPASLQPPMGIEPALTRVIPPPIVRPADTGAMQTAEMQPMTQAIADRSSFALVAEGTCGPGVGVLRPGSLVNVRGVGRVFNGAYLLTKVHHVIGPEGYVQRFEARRNAVTMTGAELYATP